MAYCTGKFSQFEMIDEHFELQIFVMEVCNVEHLLAPPLTGHGLRSNCHNTIYH